MVKVILKAKIPWKNMNIEETRNYNNSVAIDDIFAELGIEKKEEGNFLVAINGKIENKDYLLQDGDEVSILPSFIGG